MKSALKMTTLCCRNMCKKKKFQDLVMLLPKHQTILSLIWLLQ